MCLPLTLPPENTDQFGKAGYPYHVAAHYAAQLWLNQTQGQIGVVLTIVTPEVEDQPKDLQQYVR